MEQDNIQPRQLKMKLPINAHKTLKKICEKKTSLRENLKNPYFDSKTKKLHATNNHVVAYLPVEDCENDSSGVIPLDAIDFAGKNKIESLSANGSIEVENNSFSRPDIKYPDTNIVYKEAIERKETKVISFNPQYLLDLSAILSKTCKPDSVTLEISGADQSILVISNNNPTAHGVLMPVRNPTIRKS